MNETNGNHFPIGAALIGFIGAAAIAAGILAVTGAGAAWHPLLESRTTGIALLGVGIALSYFELKALFRFARGHRRARDR